MTFMNNINPMSLPILPKKGGNTIAFTVRLNPITIDNIKTLAKEHGLSQSNVLTYLVNKEYEKFVKKKNRST